jgi:hypothetical protein
MGFNMSWIFVDGIDAETLYKALDLAPTGDVPDEYDLGTSRVPLAGATVKSGWCAVFAKYALVLDAATGTNPPRLANLPAKSRSIICVVLEGAMISYAGLWQGGRYTWQIRHDSSQGVEHLETSGDLPPAFAGLRDISISKRREREERRQRGELGVDYLFDVPIVMAATMTGYRHDRAVQKDFFQNLNALVPTSGLWPISRSP